MDVETTRQCVVCGSEKASSDFLSGSVNECESCTRSMMAAARVVAAADLREAVNHPSHYGGDTVYETIKVLKAWLTPEEYRGFLKGNAIKYLSRAGKKGSAEEDHKKAAWYLAELNK